MLEDIEKNLVPENFPGNVGIVMDERKDVNLLHESYRKENTPEFEYFFTALLPKIGHRRIEFDKHKRTKLVSDIYTVPDEAFGLLILCNEHHIWVWQNEARKQGKSKNQLRRKKRFVDCNSGSQDSWSAEGISIFHALCGEIKILRESRESIQIEEQLKAKLKQANPVAAIGNSRNETWFEKKYKDGIVEKFRANLSECI